MSKLFQLITTFWLDWFTCVLPPEDEIVAPPLATFPPAGLADAGVARAAIPIAAMETDAFNELRTARPLTCDIGYSPFDRQKPEEAPQPLPLLERAVFA